ncbi:MAG: chloride channel protein [Tractidigestivibacter sp.]|jgi:H+/Cl- antiporter ClcA|uniref:ClC family H(+)/Cl(-) exchange transporter n=1 Tax=Tractidigestivibacter sp. TaxID=2847320 RepID=UPI003D8B6B0D
MTEKAARQLKAGRRLSRRFQVFLVGEGALVGLVGGGVVTLYRLSLSIAENGLRTLTSEFAGNALLMAAWFAILAVILMVVSKLMLWEPYTQGSGIPQTDAEVIGRIDMPWHRVMAAKFAEGTLCAFAGLSLGREGPSVQLGGMSGKAVSKALKRDRGEERLLVTCGAAAGMSAAFHAPLTGVLFAVEEIHKQFSAPLIISVMTASVVSDFLVSQVLGVRPVLKLSFANDLPHVDYLVVIVLGVVCGIAGALHNKGMFYAQTLYDKIKKNLPYARLAIPFAVAGIVAFTFPQLMDGGDAIVEMIQAPGVLATGAIVSLLIGKYLFTTISFASGAPGGTLFPLVVMGSLVGGLFGVGMINLLGLPSGYVSNFVALGVAGLFSGVVRAPVTAVVLVFELTGSLDSLLSVSIVSIIAYVTANLMKVDGFYEFLLAKLLGTTADDPDVQGESETEIHTFVVGMGSAMEGKLIKDVSWPEGTRVITIDRSGQQIVPTGGTQIEALDTLLLIMRSETEEEDEATIRQMTRGGVESRWTPTKR